MSGPAGRVLALDLGEARVGLALSDELAITAQPLGTFPRTGGREDLERVSALVAEHRVTAVVIGNPLLLSGEPGERSRDAQQFAARLRGRVRQLPVVLWDERLSTVEVERVMVAADVRRRRRRQVVDSLSAVLILQNYLDARAVPGGPGPGA